MLYQSQHTFRQTQQMDADHISILRDIENRDIWKAQLLLLYRLSEKISAFAGCCPVDMYLLYIHLFPKHSDDHLYQVLQYSERKGS